ncbi:MAG: maleylacetoacetate isomerase [Gammaproteobacteria bacterium]|nr:maleylacetoacetate isomerase [Gammaproteobacteria bacterium]
MGLTLYTYWRSSASFRVRIALNLKGLAYESVPKHLLRDGGEQRKSDYLALNPQGLVPGLEHDGVFVGQSLAICEYLEEIQPEPRLLPGAAADRARIRAMALAVACDIHPLNNLRVLFYLRREFGQDEEGVNRWARHWIATGFEALEQLVARHSADGRFCYGSQPTLADVFLLPQVFNARRVHTDLAPFPRIVGVAEHLLTLPAFAAARPEMQPDAE